MLSLHYCSGLQDCAEQLEQRRTPAASTTIIPNLNVIQPSDESLEISDSHTLQINENKLLPALQQRHTREPSSDLSDWQNISETEIE